MKINRLRLLGFKSFVEPTDLVIEQGLTGVVGPNGCGKSNLLEALRWVMGETSHKSMRAAAMDDVIFSGTTARPARNIAEVTIFIDNSERQAPAEFNDTDLIEITRRIEREAGSAYRVNGREVRARDIKILFEDAATGARSPALVRQGQISEIVNAKPEQRRRVLEDAAGIAGLHSRRHEAELRLRAAEGNLGRINDVLGGLNSQIEGLKRQARQARRYKDISEDIRKAEALAYHLAWAEAQSQVDTEEKALTEATKRLGIATSAETQCLKDDGHIADGLPPLRQAEAVKAAALARLKIEQDAFEKEAERSRLRSEELAARLNQLERDQGREKNFIGEAREILARLVMEVKELQETETVALDFEAKAKSEFSEAESALATAEAHLADVSARASEQRAKRRSLETALSERQGTIDKVKRQAAALEQQTREVAGRAPDVVKLSETTEAGQRLVEEIARIETETAIVEGRVRDLAEVMAAGRQQAASARLELSALQTERETLAKLLVPVRDDDFPPVVDALRVTPGYETALGAALGDDLEAPVADEAPVHWRLMTVQSIDPALPAGAEPLSNFVEAPAELLRRLTQVGVVDRDRGAKLQTKLAAGQRLVSLEGDLWRWDGFVAAADGATPAAQRLAERNRIVEVEEREAAARDAAADLLAREAAAAAEYADAQTHERTLRHLWRETQAKLSATRDALTVIERAARETEGKLAAIAEARERAAQDQSEASAMLAEAEAALAELKAGEDLEPITIEAQKSVQTLRHRASEARTMKATLERERQLRAERTAQTTIESERWTKRRSEAESQIATLQQRFDETQTELATLAELPAKIAGQRQVLLSALSEAEANRRAAADALATAENASRAAVQALRGAQSAVVTEREGLARTETRLENSRQRRQDESRRIRDTFEIAPEACLKLAGLTADAALPPLFDADRQLQKLKSDRERIGAVNLQADDELEVLLAQFTSMETERDDVDQAVGKLRQAIHQLNREGRKRLEEAFHTVNAHFQKLFTTLFGGGEARLEMVESPEDPLEGGLEIIAKPPGKRPVTLSLLSGGEQTLTALSLIFAVFLTNPSPICVLDEVDAPLDDANVDRFCRLMEHMAADTATRFLVITHHPMTMTRMNRLFGVTMAERGISQLVSVDLETAQSYREAV